MTIVSKNVIKRPAETTEEGAATTERAESAQEASPSSMSPSSSSAPPLAIPTKRATEASGI